MDNWNKPNFAPLKMFFRKSGFTYVFLLVNKEFQVSISATSISYFCWPTILNAIAITDKLYL